MQKMENGKCKGRPRGGSQRADSTARSKKYKKWEMENAMAAPKFPETWKMENAIRKDLGQSRRAGEND